MRIHRVMQHVGLSAAGCMLAGLLACGSSGGGTGGPGTSSRFLYVASVDSQDIAGFTISESSGRLTRMAAPFPASAAVRVLAATPDGAFLYAGNQDQALVDAYAVDSSTGALTALTGTNPSPYTTANAVIDVTIDPAGKYLFTANMSGTITAFTIGLDGKLTSVSSYSSMLYGVATALRVHPSGKWLFATTQGGTTPGVARWTIGTDGSLSGASASAIAGNNGGLAIDPTGQFLYTTSGSTQVVRGFRVDADTGDLTATTPASFDIGGNSWGGLVIDPGGRFLFADSDGRTLHGFEINADGSLTPTSQATLSYSAYAAGIATDADGVFLYMGMGDANTVACARIDQTTGNLTKMSPSFPTGGTFAAGVAVVGTR